MRQIGEKRDRMVALEPTDMEEARLKLECLLCLIRRDKKHHGHYRELNQAIEAARKLTQRLEDPEAVFCATAQDKKPSTTAFFGGSMADYVTFADVRVSLIDTSYCYVAISEANAKFYDLQPVRVMGRHVRDIVGEELFQTRAKPRLDACFAGAPQSFHHPQEVDGIPKIIRCDMHPVRTSEGILPVALVYKTDVTAEFQELCPMPQALQDFAGNQT
ncbi:MAG: PAS domain-containing protein [Mangrovicoccus sp.]